MQDPYRQQPPPPQQWQPGYQQQPQGWYPARQQYGQVQPYAPPQPYPQPMAVAPKSPGVALLISLLLPGVGSMYAGSAGIGVLILALWLVSCALIFVFIGVILVPAVWIWGMVAAYTSAQSWNRKHGIIS